jgi:lipopolysaccharide transport system ATP-binding protein
MNNAIRAQQIGKRYRIGARREPYKRFSETVVRSVTSSWRHIRSLGKTLTGDETFWALKDVTFDLQHGEVLGIIGRNGAGKSTLLKVLSRITRPTEGRAEIRGRVGSLLEVGTGFHPELTGRENIYLNGAVLGMRRHEINRKFDEIVDFSGLEKFLDTPVKRYSSGMYVRLAFAVAAHMEPEILMVDEVLAVGDAEFQKKCLGKMHDVVTEGRTVLFVSHNMTAIRKLCNRAILLADGLVARDGSSDDVVQYYLDSAMTSPGQIVWDEKRRPGNRAMRIHSVKFMDWAGREADQVDLSRDSKVQVEYEIGQEGAKAQFSLVLFDADQACVFSSLSNKEPHFHGKSLKAGRYISACQIPGNLLNAGTYYVSLICSSTNWADFRVDHCISFEAVDDNVLRGDYQGNYSGMIRPALTWETKFVGAVEANIKT